MSAYRDTRGRILESACERATVRGLAGVTPLTAATDTGIARSTVRFYFPSAEALQLAALDYAEDLFDCSVIQRVLSGREGLERLGRLLDAWTEWDRRAFPGGCLFLTAAIEYAGQEGAVAAWLARWWRGWRRLLDLNLETAIRGGQLHPDSDRDQLLLDLHGIMLAFHHATHIVPDPAADIRARAAYTRVVEHALAPPPLRVLDSVVRLEGSVRDGRRRHGGGEQGGGKRDGGPPGPEAAAPGLGPRPGHRRLSPKEFAEYYRAHGRAP